MIYHVTLAGRTVTVEVDGRLVAVDGETVSVEMERAGGAYSLLLAGQAHRLVGRPTGSGRWRIQLGARTIEAEVVDERTRAIRAATGLGAGALGPKHVRAPMPGMVVRVEVEKGDRVAAGQGVVIVEAMKMENELVAEGPGVVERVHVSRGDAVEKDQLLVSLAPLEAADHQRDPEDGEAVEVSEAP